MLDCFLVRVNDLVTVLKETCLIPDFEPVLNVGLLESALLTLPDSFLLSEWLVVHVVELERIDKWPLLNVLVHLIRGCLRIIRDKVVLEELTAALLHYEVIHLLKDSLFNLILWLPDIFHDLFLLSELFLLDSLIVFFLSLQPIRSLVYWLYCHLLQILSIFHLCDHLRAHFLEGKNGKTTFAEENWLGLCLATRKKTSSKI